eukprot:s1622_g8.t1
MASGSEFSNVAEAARLQYSHMVAEMLAAGEDVNAQDSTGRTALHWSCLLGLDSLTSLILAHDARVDIAKADDAFDAIVSESDPKLRKWMAMVMKKETEVAMAMAMAQKEKVAMAMAQKETEVAVAQKETAQKEMEVAQAKMALLQSQLDQKNRDLLAARGEMSTRYMLERYVDKIKAEARPAQTRTKPLLRQVQKLQNQSSAAQQMVDAVKACATSSNQPSVFFSDLFAHVSGQFHFPNWCGPGIKVSPSLNKAERCVLEKLA